MGDLRTAIYQKNVAYHRLVAADVAIYKRGKRGPIPATWWARRADLERDYRQALAVARAAGG